MTTPTVAELLDAWTSRSATTRVGETDNRHRAALRLLAEGEPVEPADIASATGQPVADVQTWLARMAAAGYEIDEEGRLVGAALTLRPTTHQIRVRGNDLYAWCGFDTFFLPILLQEPAAISSTCPVTGRAIKLDLGANAELLNVQPATTMVAIVGPAVLDACDKAGPTSAICTQMPLLADPEAAEHWLQDRPGVAIVDVDTAATLARAYADQNCCR